MPDDLKHLRDPIRPNQLSVLTVTGREGNRVDGRLRCGFCGAYGDVHWYPESPDQRVEQNIPTLHLDDCPARGGERTAELTVFDGDQRTRLTLHLGGSGVTE